MTINYTDKQLRAIHARTQKNKGSKKDHLILGLHEADRRYELGTEKISGITSRLHELEAERNVTMRRNLIISEIEKTKNPNTKKQLQKELSKLTKRYPDSDNVYREVRNGYRAMSTRKNELQKERNQYVKDIEEEMRKTKQ
jgi:hypothetical protein